MELERGQRMMPSAWRAGGMVSPLDAGPWDPERVGRLRHALSGHPLLQLDALRELACSMSGGPHIRLGLPRRTVGSPFHTLSEREARRSVHEVFDSLHAPGTWLAIYYAEQVPRYGALLREALGGLRPRIDARDPGMHGANLFVFLATAPTVTPYHVDRENNINLQILGRKHWRIWDPADREALPDEALEEYFVRDGLGKLRWRAELEPRALHLELGPGDGLYLPATSPHAVDTEHIEPRMAGEVSVNVAMTYFTRATRRRANAVLARDFVRRHLGARSADALPEWACWRLARTLIRGRQLLRGAAVPRGM